MGITLSHVLDLVGKLDDLRGEDTPRERFRRYLRKNVSDVGQIRDYVEECLRSKGDQYNRALQDLVNHVGNFLGFEVRFGRYRGVVGEIGFDGHWKSPTGFHIVVEVKTAEVYAAKTATLVGYVDQLISAKEIPSWEQALGLYVIGRPDPEIRQFEHAIVAERRVDQLRVVSVNSLLSLAEMMNEYDISHEDILAVIRPSGPSIDPVVDLMTRLVAGSGLGEEEAEKPLLEEPGVESEPVYWLTPVATDEEETAEEVIETLVGRERIYAFGERTPGRKELKPGDWICFYATGTGVVGHARVASFPEKKHHPKVRYADRYPWIFRVSDVKLYLKNPVVIDAETRSRLDAFRDRDPGKAWGWFVQTTRRVTEHDFQVLTRG